MKKTLHLANRLSVLRIAFGAAFLTFLITDTPDFALVMFVLAMMTDIADGYVARRMKQVTKLGSALDGIADKTVLILAFITLAWKMYLPLWVAITAIGYHAYTVMGFFLLLRFSKKIIEHPKAAKLGAVTQSFVIVLGLLGLTETQPGQFVLFLMGGVLLIAGVHYTSIGLPLLRKKP